MGVQIEELTGKVWDNCFQPILSKVSPFLLLLPGIFVMLLCVLSSLILFLSQVMIMNYRVKVFAWS